VTKLHPLLQEVYDALPEKMQRASDAQGTHRKNHLDLVVAWVELQQYDKVEGVMLYFTGFPPRGRHRRFPIRKDGTINVKKICTLVTEVYDEELERAEKHRKIMAERQKAAEDHEALVNSIPYRLGESLKDLDKLTTTLNEIGSFAGRDGPRAHGEALGQAYNLIEGLRAVLNAGPKRKE